MTEAQYKYDTPGFPGYERYPANYGNKKIHREMIKDYLGFLKLYLARKYIQDKTFKEKYSDKVFELLKVSEDTIDELSKELYLLDMKQNPELAKALRESDVIKTITETQIDFIFEYYFFIYIF